MFTPAQRNRIMLATSRHQRQLSGRGPGRALQDRSGMPVGARRFPRDERPAPATGRSGGLSSEVDTGLGSLRGRRGPFTSARSAAVSSASWSRATASSAGRVSTSCGLLIQRARGWSAIGANHPAAWVRASARLHCWGRRRAWRLEGMGQRPVAHRGWIRVQRPVRLLGTAEQARGHRREHRRADGTAPHRGRHSPLTR
jgi:hypothetical protein